MNASRCSFCQNTVDPYRKKVLPVHVSQEACDVCGNPHYFKDPDSGWLYHSNIQIYPFTKSSGKGFSSKPKKSENNLGIYKYFMNLLASSSINGINNWARTKRGICKLLWFLVLFCCGAGYSYQTFTFYSRYRNNPTIVHIQVENDGQVEFPAITICNANRFRKSEFCKIFPENCTGDLDILTIPEYEMSEFVYDLLLNKRESDKKLLGHQKDMIESCDFQGYPRVSEEECTSILEESYDPDFGNCYTIPARNKDGLPLEAREGDFWQETNDMTLLVDIEPEEYMETHRQYGIFMVVHDESTLPDIHTDGLFLSPGYSYSIGVRKSTVVLLPLPYKMNCTDYMKLPWQKRYRRRLTSRMCTVGCSQYFQKKDCKYVTRNLSLFYDNLPYEQKDITPKSIKCALEIEERTLDYCRSICGLPCSDPIFSTRAESTELSDKLISQYNLYHREDSNRSLKESMVHAKIFYSSFEHKIYKHTPKYDSMELFSFLGGYSGVWLGFSLLTVYEMLEIAVSTLIYAIRKLARRRKSNKFIHSILESRKANSKPMVKTYKSRRRHR